MGCPAAESWEKENWESGLPWGTLLRSAAVAWSGAWAPNTGTGPCSGLLAASFAAVTAEAGSGETLQCWGHTFQAFYLGCLFPAWAWEWAASQGVPDCWEGLARAP